MMTKSFKHLLFIILHCGVFALFILPISGGEKLFPYADKIVHILLFTLISMVTYEVLKGRWWTTAIGLSCYAMLVEIIQLLSRMGRSFEWGDWAMGTVGILLGAFIYLRFLQEKK